MPNVQYNTVVHCSACTKDEILEFGRNLVLLSSSSEFCQQIFARPLSKMPVQMTGGWASG